MGGVVKVYRSALNMYYQRHRYIKSKYLDFKAYRNLGSVIINVSKDQDQDRAIPHHWINITDHLVTRLPSARFLG